MPSKLRKRSPKAKAKLPPSQELRKPAVPTNLCKEWKQVDRADIPGGFHQRTNNTDAVTWNTYRRIDDLTSWREVRPQEGQQAFHHSELQSLLAERLAQLPRSPHSVTLVRVPRIRGLKWKHDFTEIPFKGANDQMVVRYFAPRELFEIPDDPVYRIQRRLQRWSGTAPDAASVQSLLDGSEKELIIGLTEKAIRRENTLVFEQDGEVEQLWP